MQPDTLLSPRRVAIIGGGPAGAFTALLLLRRARALGRELDVTIFDRKQFGVTGPRGCNMCAGIVSNSLIQKLDELGIELPPAVIQRQIEAYVIEADGTSLRLPKPPGTRIYTSFRSGGPVGEQSGSGASFDEVLREAALAVGAVHLPRIVREVKLPAQRHEPVVLRDGEGDEHAADVLIGAFGVNSRMVQTFERLGFGYRGPATAMACQGEIPLSAEEIERHFGNEVRVLMVNLPGVKLSVLVPKQRHVTASLIGREVGEAHLRQFLRMPQVRAMMPPGWEPPDEYCHCHPRLPLNMARHPVGDRILVVGDAHCSRYLKNGLDSALVTASLAADAILRGGVVRESLTKAYAEPCRRMFAWDNRCGRVLFRAHAALAHSPRVAGLHLRVAQREQQREGPRPLCRILWGMLTGDEPYRTLLRLSLDPRLQGRLLWEGMRAMGSGQKQPTAGRLIAGPSNDGPPGAGPSDDAPPARHSRSNAGVRRVAIVGGGPAGVGCALKLLRGAVGEGRKLQVVLLEAKQFGRHFNQCAGVVIPQQVLQSLSAVGQQFPEHLVQRRIEAYVLHAGEQEIELQAEGHENGSSAMRRVEFDAWLLDAAAAAGATVLRDRLTDLEFSRAGVTVYTEGRTHRVDAVVGAFGLDAGAARIFARRTRYHPPPCLETLVTKIHPGGLEPIAGLLGDRIHAYLPRLGKVEFGALIPKGNHVSVIIAGVGISGADMDRFLQLPEVAKVLPQGVAGQYYRGAFPVGLARGFRGDGYLIAGDAAGLVRPFKGGGINAALATGGYAGAALLEHGATREAGEAYLEASTDLRRDVWYGQRLRDVVGLLSGPLRMEALVSLARRDPAMRQLLYECVSGRVSYREALRSHLSIPLIMRAGRAALTWPFLRRTP